MKIGLSSVTEDRLEQGASFRDRLTMLSVHNLGRGVAFLVNVFAVKPTASSVYQI